MNLYPPILLILPYLLLSCNAALDPVLLFLAFAYFLLNLFLPIPLSMPVHVHLRHLILPFSKNLQQPLLLCLLCAMLVTTPPHPSLLFVDPLPSID